MLQDPNSILAGNAQVVSTGAGPKLARVSGYTRGKYLLGFLPLIKA